MTNTATRLETAATPLRVLVVDDDASTTKMFGWMVEMLGHEGRTAHDGPGALALAHAFRPDVVLLDLNLSEVSGHDICQQMRALPGLENCVFIAQTGWDKPEYIERSRQAGFHDHWVKPIPIERLGKLLNDLSAKAAH